MPHEHNDYHEDYTPKKPQKVDTKDVLTVIIFIIIMVQALPTMLGYQPTDAVEAKTNVAVAK